MRDPMRCPQCGSTCGPIVCRFSSMPHDIFRWNQGASQIKRGLDPRPDHDMRPDGMPLKDGT